MRWAILLFLAVFHQNQFVFGNVSHLLVVEQGDGAVTVDPLLGTRQLYAANFLPHSQRISVRPRSGLETVANGYQFRFGSDTRFSVENNRIVLDDGSLMVYSRKLTNTFSVTGPEVTTVLQGVGCALVEVGTSGGVKLVGVLGRVKVSCPSSGQKKYLMPGELLFHMPGDRGFGKKVNVNLQKLVDSSYLLSGFPNSESFMNSLKGTAHLQQESIGKVFAAEVGDSLNPNSFEILPSTGKSKDTSISGPLVAASDELDPLTELLGRKPVRVTKKMIFSQPVNPSRPFPSRLLRSK
jgi:hypothetical protein